MQLFGMIDVVQGDPTTGGWRIERISGTPWGLATCGSYIRAYDMALGMMLFGGGDYDESDADDEEEVELNDDDDNEEDDNEDEEEDEDEREDDTYNEDPEDEYEDEEGIPPAFDYWVPAITPLFPAWQRGLNMVPAEVDVLTEGNVTMKVSLDKTLWRRIVMRSDSTFDDLASTILTAFEFDNDHLYQFFYKDEFGRRHAMDDHRYHDADQVSAAALELREAKLIPGQIIQFRYDFGASWRFEVLVEKLDNKDPLPKPQIIARQGKAPDQYEW
jgi:hypothetical protein